MNREYWAAWFKAALIRAIKTFAQTLAAALAVYTSVFDISWSMALGTAGLAAFLSILTSLGGLPEVPEVKSVTLFDDSEVIEDA